MSTKNIKEEVKEKYGQAARRVSAGTSCCAGTVLSDGCCDPITSNLYDSNQTNQIPEEAVRASLEVSNVDVAFDYCLSHMDCVAYATSMNSLV